MDIKTFTVGPFSENTYLLTKNGQSVLIDPGFFDPKELNQFKTELAETESRLVAVFLTHAHVDHVLGLNSVLNEFQIPVYLNHSDLFLWENFPHQARMFGFNASGFDFVPEPLPEQKKFKMGPFTFDVFYTPGHAPDHVSLYFRDEHAMISGDVLFYESIGRTDLHKGDFDLLAATIRKTFYTLPEKTVVYPGHGPSTTIGHEKRNNPFVKG